MNYIGNSDAYETPPLKPAWFAGHFPTLVFYSKWLGELVRSSRIAKRGEYNSEEWVKASRRLLTALESVGVRCRVEGLDNLRALREPCVFVANHMSIMETVILPCILNVEREVTFIVRSSLMKLPAFGKVLATREPVVVGRESPRQDLMAVLEEGPHRLERGYSLVVFPQGTRTVALNRGNFNTLGVKLARRAGAPVVPLALQTDAWALGKIHMEFGKIVPSRPVRFAIGEPFRVEGTGREAQARIFQHLQRNLERFEQERLGAAHVP